jgi:hypothetical protein
MQVLSCAVVLDVNKKKVMAFCLVGDYQGGTMLFKARGMEAEETCPTIKRWKKTKPRMMKHKRC